MTPITALLCPFGTECRQPAVNGCARVFSVKPWNCPPSCEEPPCASACVELTDLTSAFPVAVPAQR